MGERGPARTPTSVLKTRGSWRAKARKGEPQPKKGRPRCPRWIKPEARRAWRELIPQLEMMKVLTKIDKNALVRYCQTLAMWREAHEFLQKHGTVYSERDSGGKVTGLREYPQVARVLRLSEALLRLEKQFGLTPAARASLSIDVGPPKEDSPRSRFFST